MHLGSLPGIVSLIGLLAAIAGAVGGLAWYALWEVGIVGVDGATNIVIASIICSLTAIPIGFVGYLWTKKRREEPVIGQSAMLVSVGTFGVWFVIMAYALGK